MLSRRCLIKQAGLAGAAAAATGLHPLAPLVKYPQKRPMIGLTSRPPQLETPFSIFNDGAITPNNAFFVRYHLADIPYRVDPDRFTLQIKGNVDRPLQLSLKEIRKLAAVELVAVN